MMPLNPTKHLMRLISDMDKPTEVQVEYQKMLICGVIRKELNIQSNEARLMRLRIEQGWPTQIDFDKLPDRINAYERVIKDFILSKDDILSSAPWLALDQSLDKEIPGRFSAFSNSPSHQMALMALKRPG
jgi:hypothetical protein